MTSETMDDLDLEFVRRVYNRSGGSLDTTVHGEEVAQELGLDKVTTADVVARLARNGLLRDVAAAFRVKITIRTIALMEGGRELADSDER